MTGTALPQPETAGSPLAAEPASRLPRLRWYLGRLSAMSGPEILHRLGDAARQRLWRARYRDWDAFAAGDGALATFPGLRARLAAVPLGDEAHPAAEALRRVREGRPRLLGRDWPSSPLADPELWFHDPVTGRRWPGREASAFGIDVRSTGSRIGDVKYVWELNRLQVLHPLAASAARGGTADARLGLALLQAWAEANPPYRGVNWVSGIELALRLASLALFVAALDGAALSPDDRRFLRRFVAAHAGHLAAFRSRFSSANNHLVAEGLGLLVAGLLAPDLPRAAAWREEGRRILKTEALTQILADGVGVEQSPTYQAFTMEMLALACLLAQEAGQPLGRAVVDRLALGAEHLLWLLDGTGRAPAIGDDDEGRVIAQPPDREPRYVASVVAAVAGLAGRPDLAPPARDPHLRDALFDSPARPGSRRWGARVFRDGGYTVAREAVRGRDVHLVFDHGPLGHAPLCAHGHADALAIWLTVDDEPVFVDAGTYLYFSGGALRTRLRESPAHNTLHLAGASQSRAAPGFGWTSRAEAGLRSFSPGPAWSSTGAHDGYRARHGVTHLRRLCRVAEGYALVDRLEGAAAPLPVSLAFLCAPGLDLVEEGGAVTVLSRTGALCRVRPPAGFETRLIRPGTGEAGADQPLCSRAFGSLEPTSRITLAGPLGEQPAETLIEIATPRCRAGSELDARPWQRGGTRGSDPQPSHPGTSETAGSDLP